MGGVAGRTGYYGIVLWTLSLGVKRSGTKFLTKYRRFPTVLMTIT